MTERPPSLSLSPAAIAFGRVALLPFVAGAAAVLVAHGALQHLAAVVLVAYAATVVSFIGGIHWGFGFRAPRPHAGLFGWGVVPSLVAWAALLMPVAAALALHAAMLSLCFVVDRSVYPRQGAAAWLPLRLQLTSIAVVSCLLASWGIATAA